MEFFRGDRADRTPSKRDRSEGRGDVATRLRALGLVALAACATCFALAVLVAAADTRATSPSASSPPSPRSSSESSSSSSTSTVIMISLDGARPADLRADRLPSLVALAERGARAGSLVPVNPTNTFPNHVSLVTGVHPEVHRLVNNSFHDPERGRFTREAIHSFVESEPIWSVAERHGIKSAAYFWVGSEGAWARGPGPSVSRRFSSRTRESTKVNRILSWLDEADPAKRPRLILSWFHGPDHEAHDHGPESEEVDAALAPQDAEIARLVEGLETRGLFETTTLLFVSDHGMTTARERIDLAQRLSRVSPRVSVFGIGGFSSVVFREGPPTPEAIDRVLAKIRAVGLEAHSRETAPADWHVDDERFGHIVVRAPQGTAIVSRSSRNLEGFHGYDRQAEEMAAILVARGRGVVPGADLGRVSNLAVAPTILRLLDLPVPEQMKAAPIEGLLEGIGAKGALRESQASAKQGVGR